MPLFSKVEILNTSAKSKKKVEIAVRIDFNSKDVFLATGNKTTVDGFIDPKTKLLISNKYTPPGEPDINPHYLYMKLAQDYAKVEVANFLSTKLTLDPIDYQAEGFKFPDKLKEEIAEALDDESKLWANVTKELNLLRTTPLPEANTQVVFADEEPGDRIVTQKIPYNKPEPERKEKIEDFLSVFFNEEDAEYFAWYMGAMLANKQISDYTVSKMMVMGSPVGGVGKSSLMNSITKHVFTPTFAATVSDYDAYFLSDSRFGTSYLPSKRLTVFLEAAWGKEGKETHEHDFTGMNTNAIKSIITDGYIDEEEKYGDKKTKIKSGGQVVLSNYMPKIKKSDEALNRRILPVIVKSTSMIDKAKQLGLLGDKFDEYVRENASDFASHFLYTYTENPNLITNYIYNYTDYVNEINDAQIEQQAKYNEEEIKKLRRLSNVFQYIEYLGIDITQLRHDTDNTMNDKYSNVRKDEEATWINASIGYLSKATSDGEAVQNILRIKYGNVVTKYNKRRFRCHN